VTEDHVVSSSRRLGFEAHSLLLHLRGFLFPAEFGTSAATKLDLQVADSKVRLL
jgi:hypothetical protein